MRIPSAVVLIALLAGCTAGHDDAADAGTTDGMPAASNAPAAPVAPPADEDPNVVMRYACDADTVVVVLRNGSARVSLPEGRDVDLSRITGSQPPIFAGNSLYFTVGDEQAHLSQGDEINELVCSPQ